MLDFIFKFFNDLFQKLIDLSGEFILWWFELIIWVPKKLFMLLLGGLGDAVYYAGDLVCVRACVQAISGIGPALQNIPDIVLYAFPYLHVATGIELVICAYVARFVIRRIPFIG